MSLNPGAKLGPYEILAPLGAGGMGEVYKAKDTRLDRTVAIKVLPSHVAGHPQARQRFEREARAVSSLNHPHICTLYDIGSENGVDFMVMEHIEGQTLADRLSKGALPFDQALQRGIEIADALDKAHRQGVVHRDLKPGNIMLTKSGAKLLDFGLAKMSVEQTNAAGLSALPTEVKPLTKEGSILGTFQYMAPEQLGGKEADPRTDIFAFGSVLYEMVTGRRAFDGKSQASLIAAILEREPPAMSTLQEMTPPLLDHVVRTCLAKDPDERWQSASDVMRQLKWVTGGAGSTEVVISPPKTRSRLLPGLAIGVLIGGLVMCLVDWDPPKEPPEVQRFVIAPPREEPPLQLSSPFFSPDGLWVGFTSGGKLRKISIYGGSPVEVCDASPDVPGAEWAPDGSIWFTPNYVSGFVKVPAEGGTVTEVTTPDSSRGESAHLWPDFLPDGKTVLFTIITNRGYENSLVGAGSRWRQRSQKRVVLARPRRGGRGASVRVGVLWPR